AAFDHAQDRQSAGTAGLQLHRAQRAGAGSAAGLLSLAHRDHSQTDEGGGIRVGNRLLHQPDAAGRSGTLPARGGTGMISRRGLLMASAGALACGRRKATAYPGYCFVANRQGRSVAVVDLSRFGVRKQIALDAEPAAVLAHPRKSIAFAMAPSNGTLYELDAATLTVSRRLRAGSAAVEMRLAPDGLALWILYRDPATLVEVPLDSLKAAR